jgi:hypothetical protein
MEKILAETDAIGIRIQMEEPGIVANDGGWGKETTSEVGLFIFGGAGGSGVRLH